MAVPGRITVQMTGSSDGAGWLPCFRALAATAVLVREAGELTLGQNINVKVPHGVTALMNSQGHK